jgi:hypothetical protein
MSGEVLIRMYSHEIETSGYFSVSVAHTNVERLTNMSQINGGPNSCLSYQILLFACSRPFYDLEQQDAYRLSVSVA